MFIINVLFIAIISVVFLAAFISIFVNRGKRLGLFTHEVRQIVIYIKDHTNRSGVMDTASVGNKVHFRDCRTIDQMKRDERFDRYVVTNRRNGSFLIDLDDFFGGENQEFPLNPCQNCLSELNYKKFQ